MHDQILRKICKTLAKKQKQSKSYNLKKSTLTRPSDMQTKPNNKRNKQIDIAQIDQWIIYETVELINAHMPRVFIRK
jgi:hypothetical protein